MADDDRAGAPGDNARTARRERRAQRPLGRVILRLPNIRPRDAATTPETVDLTEADAAPEEGRVTQSRQAAEEEEIVAARAAYADAIGASLDGAAAAGTAAGGASATNARASLSQGERRVRAASARAPPAAARRIPTRSGRGRVERPNRTGVFQPVREHVAQFAQAVRSTVGGAALTNALMQMPAGRERTPEEVVEQVPLALPQSVADARGQAVPSLPPVRSRSDMGVGRPELRHEAAMQERSRSDVQREAQNRRDGRVASLDVRGRPMPLPTYDRMRATVPGDFQDHRRLNPDRQHLAPPISVEEFCAGDTLEARRVAAIPVMRTAEETRRRKRSRAEAHASRCHHLGGRGWLQSAARRPSDLPFVRCREEVAAQRRVSRLVEYYQAQEALGWPDPELERCDMVTADRPFNQHWFLGQRARHWSQDYNFEHRRRCRSWRRTPTGRDEGRPGWFVGWSNVEFDDVPGSHRDRLYLQVYPEFEEIEATQLLCVATPLLAVYHTSALLAARALAATRGTLWSRLRMALETEYAVHALMCFLQAAYSGLRAVRCADPRAYAGFPGYPDGRLCELSGQLRNVINATGFFSIIAETTLEPCRAWLAFETSRRIDWDPTRGFLVFDASNATVSGLRGYTDDRGATWPDIPVVYRRGFEAPTAQDALSALNSWVGQSTRRATWRSAGDWPFERPHRASYGPLYASDPMEDPGVLPIRTAAEVPASTGDTPAGGDPAAQEPEEELDTATQDPAGRDTNAGTAGATEVIPAANTSSSQPGSGGGTPGTTAAMSNGAGTTSEPLRATEPTSAVPAGASNGEPAATGEPSGTSDPTGRSLATLQEVCREAGRDVPSTVTEAVDLAASLVYAIAARDSRDATRLADADENDLRDQLDRVESDLMEERVSRQAAETRATTYRDALERLRAARASERRRPNVAAENAVARTVLSRERDRVGRSVADEIGSLRTAFTEWLADAGQRLAETANTGPTVEELRASESGGTGGADGTSTNGTGGAGPTGGQPAGTGGAANP